jgi:hypothetical protein
MTEIRRQGGIDERKYRKHNVYEDQATYTAQTKDRFASHVDRQVSVCNCVSESLCVSIMLICIH